jgi:hypothetical protein
MLYTGFLKTSYQNDKIIRITDFYYTVIKWLDHSHNVYHVNRMEPFDYRKSILIKWLWYSNVRYLDNHSNDLGYYSVSGHLVVQPFE